MRYLLTLSLLLSPCWRCLASTPSADDFMGVEVDASDFCAVDLDGGQTFFHVHDDHDHSLHGPWFPPAPDPALFRGVETPTETAESEKAQAFEVMPLKTANPPPVERTAQYASEVPEGFERWSGVIVFSMKGCVPCEKFWSAAMGAAEAFFRLGKSGDLRKRFHVVYVENETRMADHFNVQAVPVAIIVINGKVTKRYDPGPDDPIIDTPKEFWDWYYEGRFPFPTRSNRPAIERTLGGGYTPSASTNCPCPRGGPCPCPPGACPCPNCPAKAPSTAQASPAPPKGVRPAPKPKARTSGLVRYSGGPSWGTNFRVNGRSAQSLSRSSLANHMTNSHRMPTSAADRNGDGYASKQEIIRWLGYDHAQRLTGSHTPRSRTYAIRTPKPTVRTVRRAPTRTYRPSTSRRVVRRSCPNGRCPR